MTLTDQILMKLLNHQRQPISGEELANELNITRNTVWNHINDLKEQGYQLTSQPGKGYTLTHLKPSLDSTQLDYFLDGVFKSLHIEVLSTTPSTNNIAKTFQTKYPLQPALFVTPHQTQGRGRYGKSFVSNLEQGIYFTLVLPPFTNQLEEVTQYTLIAAVAVVEALKPWVSEPLWIKWVNDIFYNNKKVAGILCESVMNLENYEPQSIIIGIGINLLGSFAKEDGLDAIAGTVFDQKLPFNFNMNQFVATIVKNIAHHHQTKDTTALIDQYDRYLLGKGQLVTYQQNNQCYTGVLKGVNHFGQLLIEQNSQIKTLLAGDVSLTSKQFAKES